jgi:DNA primase
MDNSNFEISHHWKTSFDRHTPSRDEVYREEVMSCMNYLKLRKIKRLIAENQRDMERSTSAEEQLSLVEVHQHLKELEMQLARNIGTVIIK